MRLHTDTIPAAVTNSTSLGLNIMEPMTNGNIYANVYSAGETAIAAVTNDGRLIDESADLLFHLIVLLKSQHLSLHDVMVELKNRNANQ